MNVPTSFRKTTRNSPIVIGVRSARRQVSLRVAKYSDAKMIAVCSGTGSRDGRTSVCVFLFGLEP